MSNCMLLAPIKSCSKCKQEFPATAEYFYKDCREKSGLCSRCKDCAKQYQQSDRGKESHKRGNAKAYGTIWGYLGHVYKNMKYRCNDPKCSSYKYYGGRGIKCLFTLDEFRGYVINVLQVDPRGLTIDRIDNSGHYEPGNIRFVTQEVNNQNRG